MGSAAAVRLLSELAGDRVSAADVFALSELWLTSLDQISEHLLAGHTEAARHLDADVERARRVFLDDLLIGRQASLGAIRDRARTLGISPPDPGVLVVAEPGPEEGHPQRGGAASAGMDLLDEVGRADALTTTRSGRVVLLVSPEAVDRVTAALGDRPWRACVLAPRALTDMTSAYRLADDAVETAPPHAFGGNGLLGEADACVLALLNGGPVTPEALRGAVLGPLLSDAHRHLLQTLRVYFREGAATTAADTLHVHPQTLRYRLRRVRELTGHDPHRPWPRFVLETACAIAR